MSLTWKDKLKWLQDVNDINEDTEVLEKTPQENTLKIEQLFAALLTLDSSICDSE